MITKVKWIRTGRAINGWLTKLTMIGASAHGICKCEQWNRLSLMWRLTADGIFAISISYSLSHFSIHFADGWHCRVHIDRMVIDWSVDCIATDATWKLFIHWIVCADQCGIAHIDHCIFGLLWCAQRVPMHVGDGKCSSFPHWIPYSKYDRSHSIVLQFFCFLLVVLVAEIATGVYAYQYRDKLNQLVQVHVKETVREDYNVSDTKTAIFDVFQTHVSGLWTLLQNKRIEFELSFLSLQFQCCGAEGPLDWKNSKFNNNSPTVGGVNLDLSKPKAFFKVPRSCCRNSTTEALCAAFEIDVGASRVTSDTIYSQGCTKKLLTVLQDNLTNILAVLAGIIGVEILALLVSLCLCCAVGDRDDHYKS